MRVDNVSFQAQVPNRLKNKLYMEAYSRGRNATTAFVDQLKKVEDWGLDTTAIAELENFKERKTILSLFNSYHAPLQHVELPQKETIFDTFMALTKQIVIEAENKLKI